MTFISLVGINFLLGIAWLFLVFYVIFFNNGTITFVFLCLFLFFTGSQGFFIFFFFVVLNADARKAWKILLCPCKKKAKRITSTNNKHLVKRRNRGGIGTLSSAVPSYQSTTIQQNTEKCCKQPQERLPFKEHSVITENEEGRSPDVIGPPLEYIHIQTSPKEEPEGVKKEEKEATIIFRRVHRQSSQKVSHDIEMVELDFGPSSDQSLNEEDL